MQQLVKLPSWLLGNQGSCPREKEIVKNDKYLEEGEIRSVALFQGYFRET